MSANDGGPAFPLGQYVTINGVLTTTPTNGMTLRDYFAAAALTGYAAGGYVNPAEMCYAAADAMLAERARKEATP